MDQAELLLYLLFALVVTALPGIAAVLCAARLGLREIPVLLGVGLAASGIVALLSFWSYYGSPEIGETFLFFSLFGSILACGWALWGGIDRSLLRALSIPLALWILGTTFLVFLGFLHGGNDNALVMSGSRFTGPMPNDNDLPRYFASWFYSHGHLKMPSGEWLASDRPPLQIGYVLGQKSLWWGKNEALHYQLMGVLLQQLWIIGLWALLLAARVGRVTRGLVILVVLASDVGIVQGFFVWPKMLPAAMLLAAAAVVMTPLWSDLRRSLWGAALVAALFGVAMMGHGSSIFGILPLAAIAAWRGLPSWRWIGVAALVGIAIMAPWSAYQKYGDPPGNRLTKYMLAGVPEIDKRSTREAIIDSYREVGLGGAIHNKAENFVTMAGGGPMVEAGKTGVEAAGNGDWATLVREIRIILFFCLLPSLGLFLVAPVVMAIWRKRGRANPREWTLALNCWWVFAVGVVLWGLILFGNLPARTVIHAGTFVLPILGFCGAVVGLRATFPRFAIGLSAVQIVLMLALYVPAVDPLPETSYSFLAAVLAAAALVGFGLVAFRTTEEAAVAARAPQPLASGRPAKA